MGRRMLVLYLLSIACLGPSAATQQPKEPAGKVEIAKHPLVLDAPVGPQTRKFDPAKLHEEADELARLAQSVPDDVGQIMQGKMPKDAINRLRRIEKLSKQLRGELRPR